MLCVYRSIALLSVLMQSNIEAIFTCLLPRKAFIFKRYFYELVVVLEKLLHLGFIL